MKIFIKTGKSCAATKISIGIILVLLSLGADELNAFSFPSNCNSNINLTNITSSDEQCEVNPRFVENGTNVLYLVFTGNPNSPKPWDYILSKSDRDGHTKFFLTTNGVIDFSVMPDERGVLVLKALPSQQKNIINFDIFDENIAWELLYINLYSGEEVLLESSVELPMSEGYKMLGMTNLYNTNSSQFFLNSPQNTTHILLQQEQQEDFVYFRYYLLEQNEKQVELFQTESWKSYSDLNWLPTVAWLSESKFVTINFKSIFKKIYPQSAGLFSIVSIDINDQSIETLYSDSSIKPFPKFVLNPSAAELFFQKNGKENSSTELWKLNLHDKSVELIFSVVGEIGDVRFSPDGSSLVVSQLVDNNFDIIRVDLNRNKIQRLGGK